MRYTAIDYVVSLREVWPVIGAARRRAGLARRGAARPRAIRLPARLRLPAEGNQPMGNAAGKRFPGNSFVAAGHKGRAFRASPASGTQGSEPSRSKTFLLSADQDDAVPDAACVGVSGPSDWPGVAPVQKPQR